MVIEEHAYLEILMPNAENWLYIGENNIIRDSLSITQKCMDDSSFMLGGVYSAQMSVKVRIIAENANSYTVTGSKIEVWSWYGSEQANKRQRGVFWATSVSKNGDIFTISASDSLIWLDSASYGSNENHADSIYWTLCGYLNTLNGELNDLIGIVNGQLEDDKKIKYYSNNQITNNQPSGVGYTLLPPDVIGEISTKNPRDYVSWIAEIAGGFVTMDYSQGYPMLKIGQFSQELDSEILEDEIESDTCEIADFEVDFPNFWAKSYTGATVGLTSKKSDVWVDISDNPFKDGHWCYAGRADDIISGITVALRGELSSLHPVNSPKGFHFRPFSLRCHSQKYFENGQKVRLPNGKISTLTSVKWQFRGGYTLGCTGKDTRVLSLSARRSQATKVKDLAFTKVNTEIAKLKKSISGDSSLNIADVDNKINQLQQNINSSLNYYFTENDRVINELDERIHNDWVRLKINVISPKKYIGGVFGAERIVARTAFSAFDGASVFLDFSAIITGTNTAVAKVYVDGAIKLVQKTDLIENFKKNWHFTLPIFSDGTAKQVKITVDGTAEIAEIQAFLWGQGLAEEPVETPENSDYIYENDGGTVTIERYIGAEISPQIPDTLGGGVTKIVEKSAFSDTQIESVYIPDGVSEIK